MKVESALAEKKKYFLHDLLILLKHLAFYVMEDLHLSTFQTINT